jgi:PAS domain S-box-containing protein
VCPREPETAVHAAQTVSRLDDWTFMAFAESAQVGLYLTDAEGGCTYANPRWLEMAGLTMDEARGSGWMRGLHPEDRESTERRRLGLRLPVRRPPRHRHLGPRHGQPAARRRR